MTSMMLALHLGDVHSLHFASSLIDIGLPALYPLRLVAAQPGLDPGELEVRCLHLCLAQAAGHDEAHLYKKGLIRHITFTQKPEYCMSAALENSNI